MPTRAAFLVCLLAAPALAQPSHWINPAGGSFGNANNWSPAVIPSAATGAAFDLDAAYTVTLDTPRTVNGLTASAGSTVLNLAGQRLTVESGVNLSAPNFTLRDGELYLPPTLPYTLTSITAGSVIIGPDAWLSQVGGAMNISPGASLTVRGVVAWCTPSNQCVNYFLTNDGEVHVEGGTLTSGSYSSTGLTVMDGGLISNDGCSSSGHLELSNGARFGGWSGASIGGTFHAASGSEIYSMSNTSVLIHGVGLMEGQNTRISGNCTLQSSASVTLRDGATIVTNSVNLRDSSSLILRAGGVVTQQLTFLDSSRLRLEPLSVGPGRIWFASNNTTLEFVLDASHPLASPPRTGANAAEGRVLKGNLVVEVRSPNRLSVGDVFPLLIEQGGFTGSFASVTLPALDGGRVLEVGLEPTAFVVRVVQGPPSCYSGDFNADGDFGTDQDIEAFFACLAGQCCPSCPVNADFNGDGDVGTDQDIEAFFRVLSGTAC